MNKSCEVSRDDVCGPCPSIVHHVQFVEDLSQNLSVRIARRKNTNTAGHTVLAGARDRLLCSVFSAGTTQLAVLIADRLPDIRSCM